MIVLDTDIPREPKNSKLMLLLLLLVNPSKKHIEPVESIKRNSKQKNLIAVSDVKAAKIQPRFR